MGRRPEVALEIQGTTQQRHNPLSGYRPATDGKPGDEVLEELHGVQTIVAGKAGAEETAAFGRWLLSAAQAAADAAKEGGFMGFGAEQPTTESGRCWTGCARPWPSNPESSSRQVRVVAP